MIDEQRRTVILGSFAPLGPTQTKVIAVLAVLFVILFLACLLAPWLGTDTSDARSEESRPEAGWFPPLAKR